jgi:thioesterase domain-containing protein
MIGIALGKAKADKPGATTVEALTGIWERVLHRSPIGIEENFFDLGGTDAQADQLFAEIAGVFHRQIPTAAICYAPTICALAALLEQPSLPKFSPLVPLKAGGNLPPVLITHGLGGRASFSELAKHIHTDNPIYGIQAKGVDGRDAPLDRIEDMAAYYLDALDGLPPQNSYVLIGYSFGGLIALEMAQRLLASGKHVALLTLIDTYPHPRYLPLAQRVWLEAKRAKFHFFDPRLRSFREVRSLLSRVMRRKLQAVGDESSVTATVSRFSFAEIIPRVRQRDLLAMRRYRPRFYPGKMKFIRPESNSYLPNDPEKLWKHSAAEFELETVPGDHLGMIGTHFESLAAVLTRDIREACPERGYSSESAPRAAQQDQGHVNQ